MLGQTHIGALMGMPSSIATTPYELVAGKAGDVTTSALTPPSFVAGKLGYSQNTALQSIKDYVADNVPEAQSKAIFAQIAAVEAFMMMNNKDASGADPVYSILAGNSGYLSQMPLGSFVNGLF